MAHLQEPQIEISGLRSGSGNELVSYLLKEEKKKKPLVSLAAQIAVHKVTLFFLQIFSSPLKMLKKYKNGIFFISPLQKK